jgi:hypothetical protein
VKYNSIYNNFSSGELSRYVKGRTDIEEYFKGVEEMTNFIPQKQGGAFFRPGTLIDTSFPTAISNTEYVMHPFTPSDGKNYMVYCNPDSGSNQIVIIETTSGTQCTITKSSYIWNTHVDFTDSSSAFAKASSGVKFAEYCQKMVFLQQGDVFIILDGSGDLAPIIGARTGDTAFTVDSFLLPTLTNAYGAFTVDPYNRPVLRVPYKDANINANIKLKPSGTTGSITITSTDSGGVTAINYFAGDVVGMLIRINQGTATGIARVDSKVSDSVVNATVLYIFSATTATTDFDVSAWNPVDGYPRSGCFFEGRLFLGGNKKFPDMIWASYTGNIGHFMQTKLIQDATTNTSLLNFFGTVTAAYPFNFVPASKGANAIQWMIPSDTLLVGTAGSEFSVSGSDSAPMSLTSVFVKSISQHGSSKVQPVKVGSSLLFVSLDGRRLLEIPKRLVEYTSATELTSLSEGILEKVCELNWGQEFGDYLNKSIIRMAYQESESLLWLMVRDEDLEQSFLLSLTYDKTSKTLGWAKHKFGGGQSVASVFSMAVLPDFNRKNYSTLYLYTYRGSPNFTVEKMTTPTRRGKAIDGGQPNILPLQSVYLDAAKAYDPSIDFTGNALSLGTEHASILIDGDLLSVITPEGYIGDFSFDSASGTITIPNGSTYTAPMIVGFKYTGTLKTMASESGAQFGVAQGSARRTHEISVFVDRSLGGKYKAANAVSGPFDIVGTKGSVSALYTGEVRLSLNASPDDHQITVTQDKPFPMNILWMLTKGYTYDA